jgi:hypothetical protein
MKKSLFVLAVLSLDAMAGLENCASSQKEATLQECKDFKRHVAVIAKDYVVHYEKAIVKGTSSADYLEKAINYHTEEMFKASSENCADDIQLSNCINDLLCNGKIANNLEVSWMDCE